MWWLVWLFHAHFRNYLYLVVLDRARWVGGSGRRGDGQRPDRHLERSKRPFALSSKYSVFSALPRVLLNGDMQALSSSYLRARRDRELGCRLRVVFLLVEDRAARAWPSPFRMACAEISSRRGSEGLTGQLRNTGVLVRACHRRHLRTPRLLTGAELRRAAPCLHQHAPGDSLGTHVAAMR